MGFVSVVVEKFAAVAAAAAVVVVVVAVVVAAVLLSLAGQSVFPLSLLLSQVHFSVLHIPGQLLPGTENATLHCDNKRENVLHCPTQYNL